MTGFTSKRRIALDRLDDDDIQIYAQLMTEEEARTLAMKYAASMGYPSSMLKDMFAPSTIKRGVVMAQPAQEPVATVTSESGNAEVKMSWWHEPALPIGTKLYTTPQQRPWVDLGDSQIEQVYYDVAKLHRGAAMPWGQVQFGKALQALIKEKNT